jgi:predicted ATPase
VRELVNKWLSAPDRLQTPYELRIRHLLTIDELQEKYYDIIENIEGRYTREYDDPTSGTEENPFMDLFGEVYGALGTIEKSQEALTDIQELNIVDKRSETVVSHRDVGIGVSQVLPVLVSAYASQEKIIAIEQPEIHLHPALQADLGDVFIQSALGENKNRFLIETHSEHLLLRIMRRIRETTSGKLPKGAFPVRPEDVMVLFVEPDGSRSVIHEMPLDTRGRLTKEWPGGFFEEGFEEMF